MPQKSLRFCLHHGCCEITSDGYCPAHKAEQEAKEKQRLALYDKRRGNAQERGYDAVWAKARMRYLTEHPLCESCEKSGTLTASTLVHHIKHLEDGGARLDQHNLMALCRACHERVHGRKV